MEREELVYECINKPKQKKEKDFSKKLADRLTFLYSLTLISNLLGWFIKGEAPVEILMQATALYTIVVSGYFTKSTIENREKIKAPNETLNKVSDGNW